jgi:midasin (ATPase involved in ribosome maturation)
MHSKAIPTSKADRAAATPFQVRSWHKLALTTLAVPKDGRLLLLVGEPAAGKTTFAFHAAKRHTGDSPEIIQGTPETELNHIWGYLGLAQGETQYCDGPLPRALKQKRWLLVEEFNLIKWDVRQRFLELRESDSVTNPVTGERITIDPAFRLIATSNPENLKCRRNATDAMALMSAFRIIEVPALMADDIRDLLCAHYPQAGLTLIDHAVALWDTYADIGSNETKTDYRLRLTYRAASHLVGLLLQGVDERDAVNIALVNKYIFDSDLHTAAQLKASFSES